MSDLPNAVIDELNSIEWLEPWWCFYLEGINKGQNLTIELRKELAETHALYRYGDLALAIAARGDQDDVLFWLPGAPEKFAVVHLTWSARPEPYPGFPNTVIYDSLADFIAQDMEPTHQDWIDS